MKIVLQRVQWAHVEVDEQRVGEIGPGYLVYLAIHKADTEAEMDWLINRIVKAKLFDDGEGRMGRTLFEVEGRVLLISQFTLYGTMKKGAKPSFSDSAPGEVAQKLYEEFGKRLEGALDQKVEKGIFAADMKVQSLNDGPVTLVLDTLYPKG